MPVMEINREIRGSGGNFAYLFSLVVGNKRNEIDAISV